MIFMYNLKVRLINAKKYLFPFQHGLITYSKLIHVFFKSKGLRDVYDSVLYSQFVLKILNKSNVNFPNLVIELSKEEKHRTRDIG